MHLFGAVRSADGQPFFLNSTSLVNDHHRARKTSGSRFILSLVWLVLLPFRLYVVVYGRPAPTFEPLRFLKLHGYNGGEE